MKVKKLVLVLLIALIFINMVFLPINHVKAIDKIFDDADKAIASADEPESTINTTELKNTSTTIYKTLLTIAICVSVLVGAVLGIQFMLGSVEGKVKVQEALIPYIIGCFVVFGAFTIWSIVVNIGNGITSSDTKKLSEIELKTSEEVAEKAYSDYEGIENGTLYLTKLDNNKLKKLYNTHYVGDDIKSKVTKDPRSSSGTVLSIEEAVNQLSSYKKKIYEECKRRDLLNKDEYTLKN